MVRALEAVMKNRWGYNQGLQIRWSTSKWPPWESPRSLRSFLCWHVARAQAYTTWPTSGARSTWARAQLGAPTARNALRIISSE